MTRGLRIARQCEAVNCNHCGFEIVTDHCDEHEGLCCDCYDLKWFHRFPGVLEKLNRERAAKGMPPVPPWPKVKP
jgi:hypothetical protein